MHITLLAVGTLAYRRKTGDTCGQHVGTMELAHDRLEVRSGEKLAAAAGLKQYRTIESSLILCDKPETLDAMQRR